MKGLSGYRGICMVCIHIQTCTFPRNGLRTILQCEEAELKNGQFTKIWNRSRTGDLAGGTDGKEGICATCEDRKSCAFPGARMQVLFCDEFRGEKGEAFYVDHV
jgi:hypothetical protein